MTSYCTCHRKYVPSNYKETEADDEGICLKCGHYCVYTSIHETLPRGKLGSSGKGSVHGYRPVFKQSTVWNKNYKIRKFLCDIYLVE